MEKAYKVALEIIRTMCENEEGSYMRKEIVKIICETALEENANKELNKAINEATSIANGGSNNV